MFIEYRLERLFKRIPAGFSIPLRVVLWNGREFKFSSAPTVTVYVPSPAALRYFIRPDLNKLGAAFVEGHIRVEGSVHELFRVAESLVSRLTANPRGRIPLFRPSNTITMYRTSSIRCSSTTTWSIHALTTGTTTTRWRPPRNTSWTTS
jgi:hypothetical protein